MGKGGKSPNTSADKRTAKERAQSEKVSAQTSQRNTSEGPSKATSYKRGTLEGDQHPKEHPVAVRMSVGGTLERGAHHQPVDLSEELPPLHPHPLHPMGGGAVVVPPPYSAADGGGSEGPLELRGSLDCWACSVLVTAQNLLIAAINACLAALVFGSILTPAVVMVLFGFLCHSTVRPQGSAPYCSELLTDGGCVALLVVGFLLMTPLLVLALAAYCRLARHLQLGLCFIPYSRAVYKNLPAAQHRGLGPCCGDRPGPHANAKAKVWV